jgi:protein disulfide-isomerase
MKKILAACIVVLMHGGGLNAQEQNLWTEDYAKAYKMSQVTEKPILLAFVGSDWCPWSQKLVREILEQPDFLTETQKEMILVWVDFPERLSMSEERKTQNKELKDLFQVSELPTLVLVDTKGKEVAKFGYLPLEPKEMAQQLKTALNDCAMLKKIVGSQEYAQLSGEELKTLYKKADELGREEEKKTLMEAGLKTNEGAFFLMRQYEELLEHAKLKEPEVQRLRKQIMQKDPGNHKGIHLELAVAEFQALSKKLKRREKPDKAIVPLVEYVRNYGAKDLENSWRVEMMIAQFLYSKNCLPEALVHAKMSLDTAPEEYRPEIAQTLEFLASKTSKR